MSFNFPLLFHDGQMGSLNLPSRLTEPDIALLQMQVDNALYVVKEIHRNEAQPNPEKAVQESRLGATPDGNVSADGDEAGNEAPRAGQENQGESQG